MRKRSKPRNRTVTPIMRSGTIVAPRHYYASKQPRRLSRSEIFALSQIVNPDELLADTSGNIGSTTTRLQCLHQTPGPSRPTMGLNRNRYINGL